MREPRGQIPGQHARKLDVVHYRWSEAEAPLVAAAVRRTGAGVLVSRSDADRKELVAHALAAFGRWH